MCGIAGILRRDGRAASAEEAARMAAAMSHRGPDGRGAWSKGAIALAHVRLAVRDRTEAAAQPMAAPGGEGVLVYNGEIYDEGALRGDLVRRGATFRGSGDAEVVLHAIVHLGVEAAVRRFDGMFALAWWDARESALWLVRDRFGIKPFHVAVTPERVAFASEVRGLRALPGVAARPDPVEVVRRVFPWLVDEVRPPFEGVENVRPGEAWKVTRAGVERRVWFDLRRDLDVSRIVAARREGVAAWETRVRDALEDAVRSHLVSDVPVAAFTSGGVDSNLVAAIAHESRPDLVAYTVDTCHAWSERPAAAAMAKHVGFELRVVPVDRAEYLRTWVDAVLAQEHPLQHPSQVAMLSMTRLARADGFTVVLTGEGADEVFGGYPYLRRTRDHWRAARGPWRRLLHGGRSAARDLRDVPFRYQSVRHERESHVRFAAALVPGEETRARDWMRLLGPIEPAHDRAFLAHSFDAIERHLGWILLRHDRIGMAASIEMRVPFLSTRVSDVGLHLPAAAKVRGSVGKWVLKRIAEERLPRRLVQAPKKGFDIPGTHHRGASNLVRGGAAADLLRWPRGAEADLLPRIEADETLRFQMASLEIWARLFFRGESPAEVRERLAAAVGEA